VTTILLVEDDPALRRALRTMMRSRDLEVVEADTGEQAVVLASGGAADLVLLDLGLPDIDGLEVLRRIRTFSAVPVVVLTAHHQQAEKIRALDSGADDYVTKPFDTQVLVARLRAVLRRAVSDPERPAPAAGSGVESFGDLELDREALEVRRSGATVQLTPTELKLLIEFANNPGVVLSRSTLLQRVWDYEWGGDGRLVDVHLQRLRTKIGADRIETVRGFGYKLRA